MLESLDISAEELTAVREKRRRLEEALGGRAAEPENVTRAMLDCGRLGDYETLLEQSRRVKQGVDGFLAERQRGLEGRDTAWLEPAARDMTDQLVDEAKILWTAPSATQAAADADPYLTAAALNWAQEEGDIHSDLPPELFGVQAAAAGQAAKCLIESNWDWQVFWPQILEVVTEVLLLASTACMAAALWAEAGEVLVMVSWGLLLAAAVTSVACELVEEYWDEIVDFLAGVRRFWRNLLHPAQPSEETATSAALPVIDGEAAELNYA